MVIKKETLRVCLIIMLLIPALADYLIMFAWCSKAAAGSDKAALTEYEVKAAFLFNFIKFIEWPDEKAGETGNELVLCIAGEDPFGEVLNRIRGKAVRGRTIVIENRVDQISLAASHILFIPETERDRLPYLMAAVKDRPVLTVSETEDFARGGGMINFITVDNKVRFEINPDAARRAGIQISAHLLKLAYIVKDL